MYTKAENKVNSVKYFYMFLVLTLLFFGNGQIQVKVAEKAKYIHTKTCGRSNHRR
jgi:hypothetical protein